MSKIRYSFVESEKGLEIQQNLLGGYRRMPSEKKRNKRLLISTQLPFNGGVTTERTIGRETLNTYHINHQGLSTNSNIIRNKD